MSWLVDIAGKAEGLLNKLDQNAATVLKENNLDTHGKRNKKSSYSATVDYGRNEPLIPTNAADQYLLNPAASSSSNTSNVSLNSTSSFNSFDKNGTTNGNSYKQNVKQSGKSSSHQHSKSLTLINGKEKSPNNTTVVGGKKASDDDLLEFLNSNERREIDETLLLKNEISNQTREMNHLMRNHKKLQIENETLRKTIDEIQNQMKEHNKSENGGTMKNNISRDSKEAAAKFAHELEEKDNEVRMLRERLDLELEKESTQSLKNRLEHIELENRQLLAKNNELNEKAQSLSNQNDTSEKQLLLLKESSSSVENEFMSYKEKAKMILKSKEELILSLRESRSSEVNGNNQDHDGSIEEKSNNNISENQFLIEISSLKNERELFYAELAQSRSFIDSLREDQNRAEYEIQLLRKSIADNTHQLDKERQMIHVLQDENLDLSQKISSFQYELDKEKLEKKKVEERFEKLSQSCSINNYSQNIMTKSSSFSNISEAAEIHSNNNGHAGNGEFLYNNDENENLKTRISALSSALLEKQTTVNNLNADKQLLEIRVERLQNQLREMTDSTGDIGDIAHSVIASQPLYLSHSPWDGRFSSRMKRAYSTIDSYCCQVGYALRSRPNLRLGFSVYIIMLHLWVFFILFSWSHQPGNDDSNNPL